MSKLFFRHGVMGSSKTANALMTKYNFEEKGRSVILLKPYIDDRYGENKVKSRIGLESDAYIIPKDYEFGWFKKQLTDGWVQNIIIDEAQFLTPTQIDELAECVDEFDVHVWCYGLKADFKGDLFDGSKRLLELADSIEEIKTSCWCGAKAIMNARMIDGVVVKEGEQVQIGGNESYTALCRKHWRSGESQNKKIFNLKLDK